MDLPEVRELQDTIDAYLKEILPEHLFIGETKFYQIVNTTPYLGGHFYSGPPMNDYYLSLTCETFKYELSAIKPDITGIVCDLFTRMTGGEALVVELSASWGKDGPNTTLNIKVKSQHGLMDLKQRIEDNIRADWDRRFTEEFEKVLSEV